MRAFHLNLNSLILTIVAIASTAVLPSCTQGSYVASCLKSNTEDCNVCTPGEQRLCYTPDGAATEDPKLKDALSGAAERGRCRAGTEICQADSTWSICAGVVAAAVKEDCGNQIDDDCNGLTDTDDPACKCRPGTTKRVFADGSGNLINDYPAAGVTHYSSASVSSNTRCTYCEERCDATGNWARIEPSCMPTGPMPTDLCNAIDDDCNGLVDDGEYQYQGNRFKKGDPCTIGQGACRKSGILQCDLSTSLKCSVDAGIPGADFGISPVNGSWDLDCDGRIQMMFCGKDPLCREFTTNFNENATTDLNSCNRFGPSIDECPSFIARSASSFECGASVRMIKCVVTTTPSCRPSSNSKDSFAGVIACK